MMTKEMLNKMTVKELRTYAKDNNLQIAKIYDLKKNELIEAIYNAEIVKSEEACIDEETGFFSPDMMAEAVDLENSRTDYGTENLVPMPGIEGLSDLKKEIQDNGWQKIATEQLTNAYNFFVGGLENSLQDYSEGDEEYDNAYATLYNDPENLVDDIYSEAIDYEFGPGYCGPSGSAPKEMRFAGKEFCKNVLRNLLKEDGYLKESDNTEKSGESLDKVVASISVPDDFDTFYEESKENAKPITKALKNGRTKYTCPVCDSVTKNKYNFCFHCGLLFNHDSDEYDTLAKNNNPDTPNNSNAPTKVVIKVGKKKRCCPSCMKKIWIGDNFCSYCGQEVSDNA